MKDKGVWTFNSSNLGRISREKNRDRKRRRKGLNFFQEGTILLSNSQFHSYTTTRHNPACWCYGLALWRAGPPAGVMALSSGGQVYRRGIITIQGYSQKELVTCFLVCGRDSSVNGNFQIYFKIAKMFVLSANKI